MSGLYLEGADWDTDKSCLIRSKPKVLVVQLPILKVIPIESHRLKLQVHYSGCFCIITVRYDLACLVSADDGQEIERIWRNIVRVVNVLFTLFTLTRFNGTSELSVTFIFSVPLWWRKLPVRYLGHVVPNSFAFFAINSTHQA